MKQNLGIAFWTFAAFAVLGATLGVWKIVDIIIWFFSHIAWVS